MVDPEAIMICIDSSQWMYRLDNFDCYTLQLNCVRSYCGAKLKSNRKNAIGILKMGTQVERQKKLDPTSDLDEILDFLESNRGRGGGLNFFLGLKYSGFTLQQLYPRNQKRILFFTGGPAHNFTMQSASSYGNVLKQHGIAVDVVNFCVHGVKGQNWMRGLDEFVAAVDYNYNSHILHFQADSLTHPFHVLSSTPQIISRALLEEAEIATKDLKGMNQAAAAHDESFIKIPPVLKFDDYDPMELDNRSKTALSPDNDKKVKLGKRKMVARN